MKDINVEILGAESLGVRSMCTKVATPDITIMLDPGCSLGPRRGFTIPHPNEYKKLHQITDNIIKESIECDILAISHYHHDHFKPRINDETYIHTNHQITRQIFTNKDIFVKSPRDHIGRNQKSRAKYLRHSLSKYVNKIHDSDFRRMKFGNTVVDFSFPVPHGEQDTRLGYVIMARISYEDECFFFAPDVQGPVVNSTIKYILDTPVDLLFLGGAPFYLGEKLQNFPFKQALENVILLNEKVPLIIIDHHCCRSETDFNDFLRKIKEHPNLNTKHEIMAAADFMNMPRTFLEANRANLYKNQPPNDDFLQWSDLPRDSREKQIPPI